MPFPQRLKIGRQGFVVLHVGVLQESDRSHAQADIFVGRLDRVAHKIAVKRARLKSSGQFIAAKREMVHRDRLVSGSHERVARA